VCAPCSRFGFSGLGLAVKEVNAQLPIDSRDSIVARREIRNTACVRPPYSLAEMTLSSRSSQQFNAILPKLPPSETLLWPRYWCYVHVHTGSGVGNRVMSVKVERIKGWEREVEKKVSRDLDAYVMCEGERSNADMAIQNDFFAALNLSEFKVSAIGGRNLEPDE
jgi:hypothetical protein